MRVVSAPCFILGNSKGSPEREGDSSKTAEQTAVLRASAWPLSQFLSSEEVSSVKVSGLDFDGFLCFEAKFLYSKCECASEWMVRGHASRLCPVVRSDWQRQSDPGPASLQDSIHRSKDRMGILSVPPSSEALSWDPRPHPAPSTASSCGAPMLGPVWDLTLRAWRSVKVPGQTLTPAPKMRYLPPPSKRHSVA